MRSWTRKISLPDRTHARVQTKPVRREFRRTDPKGEYLLLWRLRRAPAAAREPLRVPCRRWPNAARRISRAWRQSTTHSPAPHIRTTGFRQAPWIRRRREDGEPVSCAPETGPREQFHLSPNKQDREDKFDARVDHQFGAPILALRAVLVQRCAMSVTPAALPAVGRYPSRRHQRRFPRSGSRPGPKRRPELYSHVQPHLPPGAAVRLLPLRQSRAAPNYGHNVMNELGVPGINVDADSSGCLCLA